LVEVKPPAGKLRDCAQSGCVSKELIKRSAMKKQNCGLMRMILFACSLRKSGKVVRSKVSGESSTAGIDNKLTYVKSITGKATREIAALSAFPPSGVNALYLCPPGNKGKL
jgi:hypothetical protein